MHTGICFKNINKGIKKIIFFQQKVYFCFSNSFLQVNFSSFDEDTTGKVHSLYARLQIRNNQVVTLCC